MFLYFVIIVSFLCSFLLYFLCFFVRSLHFRHVSSPPFLCSIFKHQLVLMADDLWFSRNLDKIQLLFCKMEHSFFFLSRCKCNSRKGFQLFDSCHNAAGTFPHIQHGTEVPAIFPVFSTVKETEIPFSSFVTETSLPVNVV